MQNYYSELCVARELAERHGQSIPAGTPVEVLTAAEQDTDFDTACWMIDAGAAVYVPVGWHEGAYIVC